MVSFIHSFIHFLSFLFSLKNGYHHHYRRIGGGGTRKLLICIEMKIDPLLLLHNKHVHWSNGDDEKWREKQNKTKPK